MMKRWVILALGAVALSGCQTKPDAPGPYKTELTVKELMKYVLDPSADIVWASSGFVVDEKGETDLSPTTAQGWAIVENNAATVAETANALMLPGRAPDEPQWIAFSTRLHDAALATMKAAHDRDKAGVLRTGGEMYAACTACHTRYVLGEK
jgi:hypothetical protein